MPNIDRDFMWLSNLDTKRRNNYLEPELDDKTHFIHAVEEDIISNAIYLDFALRYIPIDTIGMSSSCRTIMEALILIEASDSGMIPGEITKDFAMSMFSLNIRMERDYLSCFQIMQERVLLKSYLRNMIAYPKNTAMSLALSNPNLLDSQRIPCLFSSRKGTIRWKISTTS